MDQTEILIIVAVILVGLFSTGIYYFARFYFSAGQEDEHASTAKKLPSEEKAEPVKKEKPTAPKDLKEALQNTRSNFIGRIQSLFAQQKTLSEDEFEELEEILYTSDLGPQTVHRLVENLNEHFGGKNFDFEKVRGALKQEMISLLTPSDSEEDQGEKNEMSLENDSSPPQALKIIEDVKKREAPQIWMVVGVNGTGKTTTIGKLAHVAAKEGLKTLVVAGDTFRAAAEDQLKIWSQRAEVDVFSPEGVKDPSAVVYDGCQRAQSKGYDVVIVDTAGRLHTQDNLMEELKKMKRVMGQVVEKSPHEVLLVLDANSGQNALMQAKSFHETLGVTGVILTKLDGTAKGGIALGVAYELGLPIKVIGVGESLDDLRPFHAREFVESMV